MTDARVTAATPSFPWLIGMSSWMLLTAVPGPMLAWLGFGIVGLVSRRPRLMILAVAAGAVAILVNMPIWGQWQAVVAAVAYLAGMVVALMVNPSWLRIMWERRMSSPNRAPLVRRQAAASGSASTRSSASGTKTSRRRRRPAAEPKPKAEVKAEPKQAPAVEAEALARTAGASSDDLLATTDGPAEPVDVNTATVDELATLPGVTRSRARRAHKERERQGGFTSVEDFGESIGLQPHEIVRLRRLASCSPRPRGERRFGRRVDY
ncbi:ComEA family DNA-binding protein [Microbacterium sp. Root166]|uniref:ComEA family DNA-binding protein n=1 Tax=Microbacterium sp. Root166 TaxID=1736478 RepID=UPI000AE05083|nr:helix-hairpin-helix domain-containing protein [Microbacterium sp. Root166]